jgi:hypothetical protein
LLQTLRRGSVGGHHNKDVIDPQTNAAASPKLSAPTSEPSALEMPWSALVELLSTQERKRCAKYEDQ